jgi:hypothetical protein
MLINFIRDFFKPKCRDWPCSALRFSDCLSGYCVWHCKYHDDFYCVRSKATTPPAKQKEEEWADTIG